MVRIWESEQRNAFIKEGGVTWAVLVAGSSDFDDLRHQADICAAYHLLKRGGLSDKNLIVMMFDSVVIHASNPPKKDLMGSYRSFQDLCKSVPKHYTGSDVSYDNLIAVLTGNKTAAQGRKVIKGNPNDHVFLYYAGHGDAPHLQMPSEFLEKIKLLDALATIDKQKRFQSIVVYLSACHSACVFDNFKFPTPSSIYMLASSKCIEGSMSTFLYTMFGRSWMSYSGSHHTNITTVGSEFEHLKTFWRFFNVTRSATSASDTTCSVLIYSLFHKVS